MNPYEMQWSSATPGLLIILLDQSGSMTNKYDDNMTKSEFAFKAVNRVINTLIVKSNFDGESPKNRAFISVIGYDSLYVLGMDGIPDDIKGLQGYQYLARIHQRYMSAYSDFFSELVIYTSIQTLARHPGLWEKYSLADTETMLFAEKDIQSGGTSEIFRLIESDSDVRHLGRTNPILSNQTLIFLIS